MKCILPTIALLISFVGIYAQTPSEHAQAILQNQISNQVSAGMTAGYATSDDILWIGHEGLADVQEKRQIDSLTIFRMASIAKPITAVAIMQLHEKGLLDLDKPISTYISDFPIKGGNAISVRHLLQHSSGMGGYKSAKESETTKEYPTLGDAIKVFEKRKRKFSPGSDFHYTTYGYVVLGWVIEKISGVSYEAYIQKNILDEVGMQHTGVEKFSQTIAHQTKSYSQKNRDLRKYDPDKNEIEERGRTNLSNRIPGGGFFTTAEDLLKFGQAILDHQLISETSLKMLWKDSGLKKEGNPYGMGWFLYGENPEYGPVYGHSGAQSGASTQLMLVPQEDMVFVVLSNTSHTWGHIFGVAVALFEIGVKDKNGE
ncbi:MAG: serine hydrolase domain-containing protein [Bacteroidota bacterium]